METGITAHGSTGFWGAVGRAEVEKDEGRHDPPTSVFVSPLTN